MGYSAEVLQKVTSELSRRKARAEEERTIRHDKAVIMIPEISILERKLASAGIEAVRAIGMSSGDADKFISRLAKENIETQAQIKALLKANGLPEDYLETHYTCPKCSDTGFVEGISCECRKELLSSTSLSILAKGTRIGSCTFSNFNVNLYPDIKSDRYKVNPREHMARVFSYCRDYAEDFGRDSGSLYLHGATGLGKTHLSLAIAAEVTKKGYDVIYASSQNLMTKLEQEKFGRNGDGADSLLDKVLDCDLLIIDDLGSEFSTSFTIASVYSIINTRINCSLPTIISTNLSLKEIEEKYSERIASRLIGSYTSLYFEGNDIRQIKAKE